MRETFEITTVLGFSLRLLISIILGFIIGFERQWTKHQAGILTNVIVCVGAYSYTAFSYLVDQNGVDFTRIAAQVVCGIGFLGAGLILRDGTNIRGLSTAATIWATAATGILCTISNIFYAIIVAFAIVVLHLLLHPLSALINKANHFDKERGKNTECFYKISVTCSDEAETDIRSHLVKTIKNNQFLILHNLESSDSSDGNTKIRAYVQAAKKNNEAVEDVLSHIGKDEGIITIGWKITE